MTTLELSEVTSQWSEAVRNLCNPLPPEPCDCGYCDYWEHRWVYLWNDVPNHVAGDRTKRRWMREGFPVRDGGWWVIAGFDERCPGCGDIERYDLETNRVRQWAEHAKTLVFMDAWRKARA